MAKSSLIPKLKTPGVYIEEIRAFPPSVAAVETAIPVFIGHTEIAKESIDDDLRMRPFRISSFVEYVQYFGEAQKEQNIEVRITETTGNTEVIAQIANDQQRSNHIMFYALQAFYANGGGPCYIVSVGPYETFGLPIQPGLLQQGLGEAGRIDEITLNIFPDERGIATEADYAAVQNDSLAQCLELQDRFAIMSCYQITDNNQGSPPSNATNLDAAAFRGLGIGATDQFTRYGAVYYPNIETIFDYQYEDADVSIVHQVNGADGDFNGLSLADLESQDNGNNIFFKRAEVAIRAIPCRIPPSAIMAGIYAATDENRGVWKAPANVGLTSVIRPSVPISDAQQADLNVDVNGRSINAIRKFVGRGTLVWGARTLSGNDLEWRYINVRRFFNFAEESIKKATNQFVFEPNDANTWVRVRSMIENFLVLQWRAGALQGPTPEQAFYVSVGLGQTMTAIDILEGRMIVEIGMAVVRPAEFIILQFIQKMPEA